MNVLKIVATAAVGLLLSCCASPYEVPVADQFESSGPLAFNGIADYLKQGDVRIVWIHGMCDHDYSWAVNRRNTLYESLGASVTSSDSRGVYGPVDPYPVRSTAHVGGSTLSTDYLVWSPLSTAFKDRLRYDDIESEGGQFPYRRASLNKDLKQTLINRCLVDAVVYAGPNGDRIRDWVKAQVCEGLSGIVRSGKCRIAETGPAPRTVLVAESLGSKLLFDALRSIWEESGRSVRTAEQLASIQSVFLLANQIPLLDAADRPATGPKAAASGELDFLSVLVDVRAQVPKAFARTLPELQVIAFSDPNDLLSYRLSGKGLQFAGVSVINVIVSNAPTYLGLFEMPDAAHCGYKWNRNVVGAVAFGYRHGIKSLAYELPKECGLVSGS